MSEQMQFDAFLEAVPSECRSAFSEAIEAGSARIAHEQGRVYVVIHDPKTNEDAYWHTNGKIVQGLVRKPCLCSHDHE